MFLVSLTLKLLACKVWKLDPPGALPFFIRIYNCLSMGLPIQSEYYVMSLTLECVGSRGRVLPRTSMNLSFTPTTGAGTLPSTLSFIRSDSLASSPDFLLF